MIWCVYKPYAIHVMAKLLVKMFDLLQEREAETVKKGILILLLFLCLLPGCGKEEPSKEPVACVSTEDCVLCGRGEEGPWGQNNVGLVSFHTFDILPIEINRYDREGELTAETTGTFRLRSCQSGEKGFRASLMEEPDRGYAVVGVSFGEDRQADREKAGAFLCGECLERILPEGEERAGLGAVDLYTGEVRALDEGITGFELGDFYIYCDWADGGKTVELFLAYCPLRHGEKK